MISKKNNELLEMSKTIETLKKKVTSLQEKNNEQQNLNDRQKILLNNIKKQIEIWDDLTTSK